MILEQYCAKAPFTSTHLLCLQEYTEDEILQITSLVPRPEKEAKGRDAPPAARGENARDDLRKVLHAHPRVSPKPAYSSSAARLCLNAGDIQTGRGESVRDTAETISRMVDGIMIRTFAQQDACSNSPDTAACPSSTA